MHEKIQPMKDDEIDLIQLIKKCWHGRKIAFRLAFVFGLLGIVFALTRTNTYTASTIFLLKGQNNSPIGGNLSGIASIAGINLNSLSDPGTNIPPTLYPQILKSTPFIENLLEISVPENGKSMSLKAYLSQSSGNSILNNLKRYTIGLPSLIKSALFQKIDQLPSRQNIGLIKSPSVEDEKLFKVAKNLITISVDKKEGFITLSVIDKNPEIAAIITKKVQNLLQQEIINFKIKNAQELLAFTEKLFAEKKLAYENLQDELASFQDQHQNISSGLFQNKLSRLESESSIAKSVFQELAKQTQQARIQVTKDTPIFTIIEPVFIPNQRTSPKRTQIFINFTLFGFLLGFGYVLSKDALVKMQNKILN